MNRRILVVDDSAILRLSTVAVLKVFGYDADDVESGSEALDLIRSQKAHYAAIIMDFHMPDMNGSECSAKIRELENSIGTHTPIIGMSAQPEQHIREECLQSGMDAFLDKGCSNNELIDALSKHIRE